MYMIRKDGLWLLGYKASGIKEFVKGVLTEVYTCVWGSDTHDAKGYEFEVQAQIYADLFGGEVVFVPVKRPGKESEK